MAEKKSPEKTNTEIGSFREKIDSIDDQILDLLENRAILAKKIGQAKRQNFQSPKAPTVNFYDPERERKIFNRLESRSKDHFPKTAIRAVFREVISACLSVEEQLKISYLGPPGTFSHTAARETFGMAVKYLDSPNVQSVFDSVSRGEALYGIVPFENSAEGGVTQTLDCFLQTDLKILREMTITIDQCLLGKTKNLSSIKRVYSHPQALGQCRNWISQNLPQAQLIPTHSTVTAAQSILTDEDAAIASRLAAELHGLKLIRENIQDQTQNTTRFVVLSKNDSPPTGSDRTSIVFSTREDAKKGALIKALKIIDEAGVNLSRIESRASGKKMWKYVFFVDMDGHHLDKNVAKAVRSLEDHCEMVKILGSYPKIEG